MALFRVLVFLCGRVMSQSEKLKYQDKSLARSLPECSALFSCINRVSVIIALICIFYKIRNDTEEQLMQTVIQRMHFIPLSERSVADSGI